MTERALLLQERALIAAAVAYATWPALTVDADDNRLILRLDELCRFIRQMPEVDRFQIEHGPVEAIYWGAHHLLKALRSPSPSDASVRYAKRVFLAAVFCYFEARSIASLHAMRLPDHVPEPPKVPVL